MKCIGITGSIAMGKTTVTGMAKELGYATYSADEQIHDIYRMPAVVKAVGKILPQVIEEGAVNTSVLRQIAFSNHEILDKLERILHPIVRERRRHFMKEMKDQGKDIIFFDIPLLYETSADRDMDAVICVSASAKTQKQRLNARGLSQVMQDFILSRQMPDNQKRKRADFLIITDAPLPEIKLRLVSILEDIKNGR